MDIKKRLNAAAKKLTPQMEASNTGVELAKLTDRLEELIDYAEAKDVRRIEAERTGKSLGVRQKEAAEKRENERKGIQQKEHDEFVADQQQKDAQPEAVEEEVAVSAR